MAKRILIMGLPGAGKTTLAIELANKLNAAWYNADAVREKYNDWDFSPEGRLRQSHRMRGLADTSNNQYVIADFVAPTPEIRDVFGADYTIWVDTISQGRYEDTNKVFVPPENYDYRVTQQDAIKFSELIFFDLMDRW